MGIWDAIREGLGWLLALFYSVIPNTGVAIILLTVLVRLVLFPLTAKQAKSMIAMQRAQPEIKKLQAKYKNDRQKLNEEMMKFYKENHINPLGGCLPLLAQMPVFFALYEVLESIQDFIPKTSTMYQAICSGPNCANVDLNFLGLDLTKTATSISGGFLDVLPYYILAALVIVSAYFQQRQTMKTQVNTSSQMQMIGKVMPLVFGFFAISLPAGVVLYFLVSNLWQIGQQEIVIRTIGTAAGPPPKKAAAAAAVEAKSTDVTPRPPSTGGVKGLFGSLSRGSGDDGGGAANGSARGEAAKTPAAGSSGGGKQSGRSAAAPKKQGGRTSTQSTSKQGGGKGASAKPAAKSGAKGAPKGTAETEGAKPSSSPSPNARRKNNRKRKR